ncbi:hypothetical protein PR003_g20757 [Phytophthora rubi]|uniref:RxLR effector protein n=1 Tax=Phytophthora rubi TaxID=129364 RepID=A0A6A4DH58_9STRA|nr:hypothetical protein PR003_g20757 [Phytophthora rubi]
MRFCYFVLAAAATLVACINAENQLSQTTSELVARTLADAPINDAVTRSLRTDKKHDEEDSLDSLDETEERAKFSKVDWKDIKKIVQAKHQPLLLKIENLGRKKAEWAVNTWRGQSLNQKEVAKKLGMENIHDTKNRNYAFFNKIKHLFKESM